MAGSRASSFLSDLSERSSPDSFATAVQTPGGVAKNEDKTLRIHNNDGAAIHSTIVYHEAAPLRRELEAQCKILLEEQLCTSLPPYASPTPQPRLSNLRRTDADFQDTKAIFMLGQMLTSGHARKDGLPKPATVAPAGQLALLSTLTVHPHRTTRLKEDDDGVVVGETWTYLKGVLAIAGPLNADFKTAFAFRGPYRPHRRHVAAGDDDDDGIDEEKIYNKYANEESLFHLAEDFWHVVGWGFLCSSLHGHRWPYWKVWLEFMVEALEADWSQRALLDADEPVQSDDKPCTRHREESLFMMYTNHMRSGRARMSRTMKAILADGQQVSRRLFQEIFRNESKQLTQEDKQEAQKIPTAVDVEQGEYGGYMDLTDSDDDLDLDAANRSPWSTPRSPRQLIHEDPPDGMMEAAPLRIRIFALVAGAAFALPTALADFQDVFVEFVRQLKDLPPPRLQLYLSSLLDVATANGADGSVAIEVLGFLLDSLLPPKYEDPADYNEEAKGGFFVITAETLTRSFLPWPANTDDLDDNVKLALVLEAALLIIPADDPDTRRGALRAAAAKGIEARKERTKKSQGRGFRGARKKANPPSGRDLYLREMMDLTGERILAYIDGIEGVDA
ncbi:hypothetical protein VDGL01_03036 [Verticillium dahliae]